MAFKTLAVDLVEDTATQIYLSYGRTSSLKVVFVPEDPEADPATVCVVAETEDQADSGDGFPLTQSGNFDNDDLELVANDVLWAECTNGAGRLYVIVV